MTSDDEHAGMFDGFDPAEHEAAARARWGGSEQWRQSARRTATYSADDWNRIRDAGDVINERLGELFDAGADPTGDEAIAQAEAWREHVDRWFYDCPPAMLRRLGELYVADPRFATFYDGADGARAGFAAWMRDAWVARADRDDDSDAIDDDHPIPDEDAATP